ncbi:MAG: hypothetical protein GY770_28820 [Aestuariibacter sp.]|nr:hypothetical protein [Aestuariibacter sp.]
MDENWGFMKKVQSHLLNNFCRRFQGLPMYVGAASILHPGLSGMNFLKEQEKKDAQEFIFSGMINFAPINHSTFSDDPIEIEHIQVASPSIDSAYGSKMIQELIGRENPNDEETTSLDEAEDVAALKLQCVNEFKMYLDVAKLYVKDKSKDKCPYKWWKHHQSSFKLLAPVARKWLGL